ncbi:MAG: TetR/AcrR family transcriptional regulator [Acidimicrobiales bacterium]
MVVQTENGGARRTQAERRLVAKDGLLGAAAELFAEQGVAETSLAQIGERAGYSRGLANHHFGSKSELIEQLAERVQAGFTDSLDISVSDTALETILRIARAYVGHSAVPSSELRALFVMWGASFPAESSVLGMAEADARTRATLATWVERGQVDGSVSADAQPAAAAAVLIGMLRGVVAQRLVDPDSFDLVAVRAECERMVRAALTPNGSPATTPNEVTKKNKES